MRGTLLVYAPDQFVARKGTASSTVVGFPQRVIRYASKEKYVEAIKGLVDGRPAEMLKNYVCDYPDQGSMGQGYASNFRMMIAVEENDAVTQRRIVRLFRERGSDA